MDNDKDCQELLTHISMLLGMGGSNIKEAEKYLNSKALTTPAILLSNLIAICNHSQDLAIKKICIVLLRRYFKEQGKGIWSKTNKQEQAHIRDELLRVFSSQSDIKILRQYCYTINELLGTMDDDNEDWPELEQLVQTTLQHPNESALEIGLRLLDALATYKAKKLMLQKEVMYGILESAFQKGIDIKIRACIVLCSLLSVINTKEAKLFQPLLAKLSSTMEECVAAHKEDEIKELLESFTDVAEAEPTFFKNGFVILYKMAITFSKKGSGLEETTRHMMIELILSIIERTPSVCKQDILEDLCSNVFQLMTEIDSEIDQDWCKPKEGFNNEIEHEEEENIKFGMMTFDRLCSCIGEKDMLQVYNVLLDIAAKQTDWRYKHAFLMSISQVGEYIDDIEKIKPLVPVLTHALMNECPKVRYASLHAIGQLADDMHESRFTATFQDELLPALISLIDDPVPRVSAHSCAALTNVLEYLSKESAHSIAPKLLPKLISVINSGISIQKENAMTAISSLAEAADKLFIDYYNDVMPFLFKCLKEINTKEYRQLRGQAIEAITIIGLSVGKEKFSLVSNTVIQELLNIQNQNLADDDPQRNYLLSAWQRICMVMENDFSGHLNSVMGSILSLAQTAVVMGIADESIKESDLQDVLKEVSEEKDKEVNTSELESKEIAIEMICVFASELKGAYYPYITKTIEVINPLLTYSAKSGIRKSAAKALAQLHKCAVEAGVPQDQLTILTKSMIGRLWEIALKEVNVSVMGAQLVAIKKILSKSNPVLTEEDILVFKQNIIKLLQESIERKEIREGVDDDEDIKDISEKEKERENNFQLTITYIVEKLFEKHPDLCTKHILPDLYSYAVNIIQNQNNSESMMQVAMYLFDDMLQYLGPTRIAPMLSNITTKILEYSVSPYSSIRQASCYGIGMLAKMLEQADFSHIVEVAVTKLREAFAIKKEKKGEVKIEFGSARDNVIAAYGKIIKYKHMCIPLNQSINEWISMLPLKYDEEEAQEQNELLIKIIIEKAGTILASNKDMQKLIDLIIKMLDEDDMINKDTQSLMSSAVNALKASTYFAAVWDTLTENQKATIDSVSKQGSSN